MFRKSIKSIIFGLCLSLVNPVNAELFEIGNTELQGLLDKNVTIVDVRRADEWRATGVVKDSHLVTFFDQYGRFRAENWLTKLAEVTNPEKPLILICQTGMRSKVIGFWLSSKLGFKQVYNVTDGIESWTKSGNSVVVVTQ